MQLSISELLQRASISLNSPDSSNFSTLPYWFAVASTTGTGEPLHLNYCVCRLVGILLKWQTASARDNITVFPLDAIFPPGRILATFNILLPVDSDGFPKAPSQEY